MILWGLAVLAIVGAAVLLAVAIFAHRLLPPRRFPRPWWRVYAADFWEACR